MALLRLTGKEVNSTIVPKLVFIIQIVKYFAIAEMRSKKILPKKKERPKDQGRSLKLTDFKN